MQITAATFSDPSMRSPLQAYYDKQKAEAVAAWKSREPIADEVSFRLPNGNVLAGKSIQISAEQMEKALVPFDKWLEFQIDRFTNPGFGPKRLEMAQRQLDMLQANGPDTSSNVRMTFSSNGVLLAAINTDGTTMTSNGSAQYLDAIVEKANDLGLSGQNRLDYLHREFSTALSAHHWDLDITKYSNTTIPTKREYGQLWHRNFDIDEHYSSSLTEAQASYDDAFSWHQQSQAYLDHMRDFLIRLQEA
jgi:hypothetical protein